MFLSPGSRARARPIQSLNGQRGNVGLTFVPQGRITATAGVPVLISDPGNVTTFYYAPYVGHFCPVFDGRVVQTRNFLSSTTDTTGLTLAMASSANWAGGNLWDLFYACVNGVFYFGTGPAWTSLSARGTGAGTTELQMFLGIWTNKNSITLRYAPTLTVTVPVNQATYLGTFYTIASGTSSVVFRPTSTAGGSNNIVGFQNCYNKVPFFAKSQDSAATWTYASATWRNANNSASNRVNFVDCFGTTPVRLVYNTSVTGASSSAAAATIGIGFNIDVTVNANVSGGAGAGARLAQAALNGTALGMELHGEYNPMAVAGLNFAQAGEQTTPVSITFNGNDFMMLSVEGQY